MSPGWMSPSTPLPGLARAVALRSCSPVPSCKGLDMGGWAPVPLGSCPSFQLGWVIFGLPPQAPPTHPESGKKEHPVNTSILHTA